MATTSREPTPFPSSAQNGTTNVQDIGAQPSLRTDPSGVEIPVVVYASRYSAANRGMGKTLPPVREETRTVIVFAQGAVVRTSASISTGEMVVLTNLRTGADVLCRVSSVKSQPGVQNYVDLEFAQRAPGFWGEAWVPNSASRTVSPASESTGQVAAAPIPFPSSASLKPNIAPSPTLETTPAPLPSIVTPATPKAAVVPVIAPAPPAAKKQSVPVVAAVEPERSKSILNAKASLPLPQLGEQPRVAADISTWATESSLTPKRIALGAVAALAVAALLGGGFLLGRHDQPASPEAGFTIGTPSAPVASNDSAQPAVIQTAAQPPARIAVPTGNISGASSEVVTSAAATAPRETPLPEDAPAPVAARRPAVPLESLAKPRTKATVTARPGDAPPVLSTQDHAMTDAVLGAGVFSGAPRVEAPNPAAPTSVRSGGQLQEPKLISSPQPVYPIAARAQSLEGVVTLDVLIDTAGNVSQVKVISGPTLLQQAAIDAVSRWKYRPAEIDGKPTVLHQNLKISFTIH